MMAKSALAVVLVAWVLVMHVPLSTAKVLKIKTGFRGKGWAGAKKLCESKGLALCPRTAYCPNGRKHAPDGGTRGRDVWVPIGQEGYNRWLSIGNYMTSYRLCGEHAELGYGKPSWGHTAQAAEVYCCTPPKVNQVAYRFQGASRLLGGKYSWSTARLACEKKGMKLCPRKAYCPSGRHKTPNGGIRLGDAWAPFSGAGSNRWVSIGSVQVSHRLCGEHQQLGYGKPSWGPKSTAYGFKKVVYCCKRKPPRAEVQVKHKFIGKKVTLKGWNGAVKMCSSKGLVLCPRTAHCPGGRHTIPVGGVRRADVWVAIGQEGRNRWLSVGNYNVKYRLCGEHAELGYGAPGWGYTSFGSNYRSMVEVWCCAPPKKGQIAYRFQGAGRLKGGAYSYNMAKKACSRKGMKLCDRKAYCPWGRHHAPIGGVRSHDVWAPFSGAGKNRWISVGNYATSYRLCGEHKELGYGFPFWGTSSRKYNFKAAIYCCSKKNVAKGANNYQKGWLAGWKKGYTQATIN